jgi:hypothetical protein
MSHIRLYPKSFTLYWRVTAAILLLLCSTTVCQAIPVADYQKNLQRAISSLESLVLDEDEEAEEEAYDYDQQLRSVSNTIRNDLPKNESIQSHEQVFVTDNNWLHSELDQLEKTTGTDRQQILQQTIERLKALDHRVGELQQPGSSPPDKAEAQKRLEAILKRQEYARMAQGPNALTRLRQDFARWLAKFLPKRAPMQPGNANILSIIVQVIVAVIALAVIVLAIIAIVRKVPRRRKIAKKVRQPRVVLGERLEPEASATDLLSDAEALARNGDIRAAIRKAYVALLVELADRNVLSLAQHKTNRDYVRSVRNVPVLHKKMLGLTDSFERHWYGFVEATPADWQDFRTGYHAALESKS